MEKNNWTLIDAETKVEVNVGDMLWTFRDEVVILKGGTPPHKLGSTGRIYVSCPGLEGEQSFFPSVCNLVWDRANPKKDALDRLMLLKQDLEMLRDGEWVPDDDSCQASLDSVEYLLKFVKELP